MEPAAYFMGFCFGRYNCVDELCYADYACEVRRASVGRV